MSYNWTYVGIFTTTDANEAKRKLNSVGIKTMFRQTSPGVVELYVPEARAHQAIAIVAGD